MKALRPKKDVNTFPVSARFKTEARAALDVLISKGVLTRAEIAAAR